MVPPEADGQIGTGQTSVPALAVSAEYTSPLHVTYAGSTTWLVSGTIQVNVKLPDELPEDGYSYLLAMRVGDSLSNYVRIPVKTPPF
jgi:uncharacterized protein (TIGR03437 family)